MDVCHLPSTDRTAVGELVSWCSNADGKDEENKGANEKQGGPQKHTLGGSGEWVRTYASKTARHPTLFMCADTNAPVW